MRPAHLLSIGHLVKRVVAFVGLMAPAAAGITTVVAKRREIRDALAKGGNHLLSRLRTQNTSVTPPHPSPLREELIPRPDLLPKLETASQESFGGSRLLCVQGETGSGKSSLVRYFLEQQQEKARPPIVLTIEASRLDRRRATPYMRLLRGLALLMQALRNSEPETGQQSLRRHAPIWSDDLADNQGSMTERPQPEVRRFQQFELFLRSFVDNRQVILFVDDVQWIDDATARMLGYLLAAMQRDAILFIFTWQQNVHLSPLIMALFEEAERAGQLERVSVDRLTDEALHALIRLHFPRADVPINFSLLIKEISGMNALFVRDLLTATETRRFINAVQGDPHLEKALIQPLREALADTQRKLVSKRLAKLDNDSRRILEQATFQDEEFDVALLSSALNQAPVYVEKQLRRLANEQLLIERTGTRLTDDGQETELYRFRHSFYVVSLRRELQAAARADYAFQAAQAQEKHYGNSLSQSASRLVDLYRIAGKPDKAAPFLVLASETSLRLADLAGALRFAEQALSFLQQRRFSRDDDRLLLRAELVAGLATALQRTYAAPAVSTHYSNAYAVALALADSRSQFVALAGEWLHQLVVANLLKAHELAAQMQGMCVPGSDEDLQIDSVEAWWAVGVTTYFQGRLEQSRTALQRGIAAYSPKNHPVYAVNYTIDPGVSCRYLLGRALFLLGQPDSAIAETARAVALAKQIRHTESEAFAIASEAVVRHLRREPAQVLELTNELKDLVRGDALNQFKEWGPILEGWAKSILGDTEGGLAVVQEGLVSYRATGSKLVLPSFQSICADCLLRAGRAKEALELVETALQENAINGQRYADSELLRWSGEAILLLSRGDAREQARERFIAALEVADDQGAQGFALRAATSLAKVAVTVDECKFAHGRICGVLDLITEGQTTYDVFDAREQCARLRPSLPQAV